MGVLICLALPVQTYTADPSLVSAGTIDVDIGKNLFFLITKAATFPFNMNRLEEDYKLLRGRGASLHWMFCAIFIEAGRFRQPQHGGLP